MTTTTCSCGTHEAHEVARRRTADNKGVILWSDGLVTGAIGIGIKGIGAARSAYERAKDVEAGWLAIGEVELYDLAEVAGLVRAARRAVRQPSLQPRDYMRAVMSGVTYQAIKGGRVIRHARSCACGACRP